MATMVNTNCKCCDKVFSVRQADLNRGWGLFCSKSCKATKTNKVMVVTPPTRSVQPNKKGLIPQHTFSLFEALAYKGDGDSYDNWQDYE